MTDITPDPTDPQPTPGNPEPPRPEFPPETPPAEPPGIPAPTPDPIPSPVEEPPSPGTPPEVPPDPGSPGPLSARTIALATAILLCWPGAANLALAQTADGGEAQGSPCQVDPGYGSDGAQRDGSGTGEGQNEATARPSLEDCNGVLVPPRIGDPDIVQPSPDAGTTPVIPPGTVPVQPANPEQP